MGEVEGVKVGGEVDVLAVQDVEDVGKEMEEKFGVMRREKKGGGGRGGEGREGEGREGEKRGSVEEWKEERRGRGMGCNECPLSSCPHSFLNHTLQHCPREECEGKLVLSSQSYPPNWRFDCNQFHCQVAFVFPKEISNVSVLKGKVCGKCQTSSLLSLQLSPQASPSFFAGNEGSFQGCLLCDFPSDKLTVIGLPGYQNLQRKPFGGGRGRGKGKGRSGGRGGGRGRGKGRRN